jgi:hypothetical protein
MPAWVWSPSVSSFRSPPLPSLAHAFVFMCYCYLRSPPLFLDLLRPKGHAQSRVHCHTTTSSASVPFHTCAISVLGLLTQGASHLPIVNRMRCIRPYMLSWNMFTSLLIPKRVLRGGEVHVSNTLHAVAMGVKRLLKGAASHTLPTSSLLLPALQTTGQAQWPQAYDFNSIWLLLQQPHSRCQGVAHSVSKVRISSVGVGAVEAVGALLRLACKDSEDVCDPASFTKKWSHSQVVHKRAPPAGVVD